MSHAVAANNECENVNGCCGCGRTNVSSCIAYSNDDHKAGNGAADRRLVELVAWKRFIGGERFDGRKRMKH